MTDDLGKAIAQLCYGAILRLEKEMHKDAEMVRQERNKRHPQQLLSGIFAFSLTSTPPFPPLQHFSTHMHIPATTSPKRRAGQREEGDAT